MSDPLPPLPEPFAVAPRPLRAPGCGRGALVGCGVLIALFGIAAVAMTLNVNRMMVWVLHRLEQTVDAKLPADLTPAERQRLSAAFAGFYRAVDEGRIEPANVQPLQRELFALSSEVDRGLSRDEVLRLTEALEVAAGRRPSPAVAPDGAAGPPAPRPGTAVRWAPSAARRDGRVLAFVVLPR